MGRMRLPIVLLTVATMAPILSEAKPALVVQSMKVTLPASTAMFPPGLGSDTVNGNCLACHSVAMVMNQPVMPKAAWEAEVNKMRNVYKAPVAESDVATIVDYLTGIKGPK
jgi:cytochrome c5